VTVIPPGGGEVIGDAPDRRVEILSDDETLHVTWSRFGAGREGADLHVHRRHQDLFYVLEGELTVRLGLQDELVTLTAGMVARMPPDVVHGFRNASAAEVRYLNLHAPGRDFAGYLRARRDGREYSYDQYPPPPGGGRPAGDAVIGHSEPLDGGAVLLADVDEIALASLTGETGDEAPHEHDEHVESLYVLDGEVVLARDGEERRLVAGTWGQVPRGARHALSFTGPARYLSLHTPNCGFAAHLRDGRDFDRRP
jgi:quercetin dioxygenase-like cupin family protein